MTAPTPDPRATDRVPVATDHKDDVPAVASARHYLRDALPLIYREQPFAMSFLEALERVLDARVAIIDCLGAYIAPELAPARMVDAMAGWLGLQLDDAPTADARRGLLVKATETARLRGTAAGLQDALTAAFPDLGLRVQDNGKAVVSKAPGRAALAPTPGFRVTCRLPLTPSRQAAVQAAIARQLPLHVNHRLIHSREPGEPAQ
jgi:phage tail-like protein